MRSSFDWDCVPAPCMRRVCAAAAGPSLTPLRTHLGRTSFSTLKSAPSSLVHGARCSASYTLLNLLGRLATDSGCVTKGAWVEGAMRRLSVALCKGNDFLFRTNLHAFCRAADEHPKRGAAVPHTIEV